VTLSVVLDAMAKATDLADSKLAGDGKSSRALGERREHSTLGCVSYGTMREWS
jgi:hypothetical protein